MKAVHSSYFLPCALALAFSGVSQAQTISATTEISPAGTTAPARRGALASKPWVEGQLLVKVNAGPTSLAATAAHAAVGAKVLHTFDSGWQQVQLPTGLSTMAGILRYRTQGVTQAQPNFRYAGTKTPNDPSYSQQWAYPKIAAPKAWDQTTGSSSVVVGIIDTGIRTTHTDLVNNLWTNSGEIAGNGIDDDGDGYIDDVHGWNAITGTSNVNDDAGHGTHVAGIIGATGNNSVGVTGVNWNVKVLPTKFLDSTGSGTTADAITCFEYLVKVKQKGTNLRVINCSWGIEGAGTAGYDAALKSAIDTAGSNDILVVCAAGNGGDDGVGDDIESSPAYPASFTSSNLVTVAASGPSDEVASFSNTGKTSVDLAAPGVDILSTVNTSNTAYAEYSGTSMATPFVSGAAALLLAKNGSLSTATLKTRLLASVTQLPAWYGKVASGGRLNLNKLLSGANYTISGMVFKLRGDGVKVGLPGARLFLDGATSYATTTGADGTYTLTGVTSGTHTVQAKLAGYTVVGTKTAVLPTTGLTTSPNGLLNFKATPNGSIYGVSGQVYTLNSSGTKTGLANVDIYQNSLPVPVATTDSSGNYQIKNRAAGSYTFSARKSGYTITAVTNSDNVSLPASSGSAAPSATLNFVASAPDGAAPVVTITKPVDGGSYTSATLTTATGTATDPAGVSYLFFILWKDDGSGTYPYAWDWVTKTWSTDWTDPDIILTKSASGTSVSWSQTLPTLSAQDYVLDVWGRDGSGTESSGDEDAFSFFTITGSGTTAASAGSAKGF